MSASSPSPRLDLDAFQTQIESKLRQTYSSLELPKSLSQSNTAGNSSTTPREFIQNLQQCFSRMPKPIQLRCLIGLLGFEPNVAQLYNDEQFDNVMRDFLESLDGEKTDSKEDKWDKWIIVMAGIIRGKLFRNDVDQQLNSIDHPGEEEDRGRNKKTDSIIKKAVEGIIQTIMEASKDAADFRNEAEVALTTTDPTEEDEKRMEKLLDSFHIGTDVKPHFVPWCYRLCSGKMINAAIPELDERCDFIVNEDADILKVDERMDRKKAALIIEEEKREQQQKERMKALAEERKMNTNAATSNGTTNGGRRPGGLGNPARRGVAGNAGRGISRPSGSDTAALMMRSKKPGDRPNASISSRLGSNSVAGGKVRIAGLGRGAAADAVGGKSLANPMSTLRKSGIARAALPSAKRPGAGQGAASSTTVNARRAAMRNKTKMKVLDLAEVEGLKKEGEERNKRLTVEEIKENKRRKIMEKAIAKGLKTKKKWTGTNNDTNNSNQDASANIASDAMPNNSITDTDQNGDNGMDYNGTGVHPLDQHDIPLLEASIFQDQRNNNGLHVSELDWNMDQNHEQQVNMQQQQHNQQQQHHHQQQQHHQQQIPQQMRTVLPTSLIDPSYQQAHVQQDQTVAQTPQWQSLLERSNKLTHEDRVRVEQFFTSRYNPTPHILVYKMKLNEDRSFDPQTNQYIKETLYIELDYQTGGHKMSRKIKKKAEE